MFVNFLPPAKRKVLFSQACAILLGVGWGGHDRRACMSDREAFMLGWLAGGGACMCGREVCMCGRVRGGDQVLHCSLKSE